MNKKNGTVSLINGEIMMWTDADRSIHIKAVSPFGDPVELNENEAREVAEELLKLVSSIE